jgi:hypothetical protein
VLAWWREPSPLVAAADGEIVSAARARLADLADPANRLSVRHPSGPAGPAFRVHGMLVWGFTALLVDRLLALGGWEQPCWWTGCSRSAGGSSPGIPGGRRTCPQTSSTQPHAASHTAARRR